jgi:hypothetical protein
VGDGELATGLGDALGDGLSFGVMEGDGVPAECCEAPAQDTNATAASAPTNGRNSELDEPPARRLHHRLKLGVDL